MKELTKKRKMNERNKEDDGGKEVLLFRGFSDLRFRRRYEMLLVWVQEQNVSGYSTVLQH
jgi:hypothetical protein